MLPQYQKMEENEKNLKLIPIIFTVFIPLVVYYHEFDTKLDGFPWFGNAKQVDVFLYWKMVAIITISSLMTCVLIYSFWKNKNIKQFKLKDTWIWLPLLLYIFLALISTVFSEYSYWGYHGITNQFEPIGVLLGYGVLTFYTYWFMRTEKDLTAIIKWLLLSMGLVFLIGAFQAFSIDFYRSGIGKMTYLPSKLQSSDITFNFEIGTTYTSLYNPNYVGILVCLLFPIVLVLFLSQKNKMLRILSGLILLAMIISLWGAGSKSGIVIIGFCILFLMLLFRGFVKRYWKVAAVGAGVLLIVFIGYNIATNNQLFTSIKNLLYISNEDIPTLDSIETNDDNIIFHMYEEKLIFTYQAEGTDITSQLLLTDGNGNPVQTELDADDRLRITDERYYGISVAYASYEEMLCFDFLYNDTHFYFTNQTGDNTYYYITMTGKFDKIEKPKINAFLAKKGGFASKRGFIWSRTVPLLKDNILLGSGADSFALVYPNNDYVGRYNYGYIGELISKPHNLYLQMGVQTGVVSVIAFVIFYLLYFVSSIKLYFKSKLDTFETQVGASILAGTFGYMLMGISNDSTITVAPIFWMLMGLGLAVNRLVRKKELLESNKE